MAPVLPGNVAESQLFSVLGNDLKAQCATGSQHSIGVLGAYSRFEVRAGDQWELDSESKNRAELYVRDGTVNALPFDQDVWLSLALRIPSFADFPPQSLTTWCVIGQIHSSNSPNPGDVALSPPWAQDISGGVFTIQTRSYTATPVASNPPPVTRYTDAAFPRDEWIGFVYRLNFDPTNGYMQAWRDGSSIFDAAIPLGYNQPDAGYLKYGVYRSADPSTSVVEFANVECGTADLSSRVTNPLPLPF